MENSTGPERLSLNSLYLPKDGSSRRISTVLSPWEFHQPKRTDSYLKRREEKSTPHPDKPGHKLSYLPSILLRAPSLFLKIICSLLNCLHPSTLPLSRQYINSQIPSFWGYLLLVFCDVVMTTMLKINKFVYLFFCQFISWTQPSNLKEQSFSSLTITDEAFMGSSIYFNIKLMDFVQYSPTLNISVAY